VLQHVPGVYPEIVELQRHHEERGGRQRRIDFAIEEGEFVRLAIEVDGYDKTGSGTGWTRAEHDDFLSRQTSVVTEGWRVLRFSNRRVRDEPEACIESIALNLEAARALAVRVQQAELSRSEALQATPSDSLDVVKRRRLKQLTKSENGELTAMKAELARVQSESAKAKARFALEHAKEKRRRARVVVAAVVGVVVVGVGAFALASQPHEIGVAPVSAQNCPADHPIKGNISTAGKIFHVPGGDFYTATKPERCFKDPAEADSAGYRRSKR
jgi:very-short-patch-repair endonuclease